MKKYIIFYCIALGQLFNACSQIKPPTPGPATIFKMPPPTTPSQPTTPTALPTVPSPPTTPTIPPTTPVQPTTPTTPKPIIATPVVQTPPPLTPVKTAPVTPIQPPSIAPMSPIQATPIPQPQLQDPHLARLAAIKISINPLFSNDTNNKLTQYKQLLESLNEQTNDDFFNVAVESFIETIISPALQSNTLTLNNISDAEETTESIVSTFALLNARLRMQPKTDSKRMAISKELQKLKQKSSELAKRVDIIKKLEKKLEETKRISNVNLIKKIQEYETILKQLSIPLPIDITTSLINDLQEVGNTAKSRGGQELEEFKKLIQLVQTHPSFDIQQKQQLTQVTYEKPTTVPTQLELSHATPTATIEPIVELKIQEIKTKQTLMEKIIGIRPLLALITAGSNQAEKNKLISFLNELFLQQSTMTKQELTLLKESFENAVQHEFFLAYNQRPIMEQWIRALSFAIELSDQQSPLIISLKNNIKNDDNYMKAIQSAYFALNLLDTTVDPAEKDRQKPDSLISIVRSKMTSFYSNRGNKTIEELDNLKNLFTAIKTNPQYSGMIVPSWEESLNISIALATTEAQTNILAKIKSYSDIAKMLKPEVDAYEKGLFVDGLTNIFANRNQRAVKELQQFKTIINNFLSNQTKQQKIFSPAHYERFTMWKNILNGTIILLEAIKPLPLDKQIKKLEEVLDFIIPTEARYEKDLFIPYLSHIFMKRGQLNNQELNQVKILFEKIKNSQNFLAANQLSVLVLWLAEINEAITTTSLTQSTYDHALLEQAVGIKDIDQIEKAVTLFTEKTRNETKNILVNSLNNLFTERKATDLTELKKLFDLINKKEVGSKPLLNDQQRDVIDQWSTILNNEIQKLR